MLITLSVFGVVGASAAGAVGWSGANDSFSLFYIRREHAARTLASTNWWISPVTGSALSSRPAQ